MTRNNVGGRNMLVLTLSACAVILASTLTYPFNNDNALYAYMADLALKGHLPYVGSWDQNFPGIVAVHAVQILVSGHSQLAFHIFDILLQLIGSALLFKIGALLYDKRAGALAAILASLYYVQQGLWMAGERDTYVSVLLLAAFYLTIEKRSTLVIGLLMGLMGLIRPTYGLYAIVFAIAAWRSHEKRSLSHEKRSLKAAATTAIGALALPLAFILLYAAIGGLRDFWDATILFNVKIYGGTGASFSFWDPIRFYAISVIAVGFGLYYLWNKNRQRVYLWAALFAASVLSLIMLYRHSVYHYHPAMTLFILISAVGWVRMSDLVGTRWMLTRTALPAIVILYFVAQTLRGNTIEHVLADLARGNIHSLEESYDRYEPSPEFGMGVQRQVGEYLRAHTHESDTIEMFGPYSYPLYYARLLTASRFQTLHAIAMRGQGDTLQPFQAVWRAEYLHDMQVSKPLYFIVCDAPEAFRQYYGGRLGQEILRDDFRELGAWLYQHYYPETKIGAFTLYRKSP